MTVTLQISDTHFGTERQAVVSSLVELTRELEPSLIILSGDITQRARDAEFTAARLFTNQLRARVLSIPGNHDIPLFNLPARLLAPYAGYKRSFGADLEPEFEDEARLILCLNTTRPSRHKDGEVSHKQISRVTSRLQEARPEQLRIVVTHQPVHVIREKDIENLLHGYEDAVHAWAEAGVDLIMGGHIHLPYVRKLGERFSDLQRNVWAVQAGTAVSSRVRDGVSNSVNVVRYRPREPTCIIERWDYEETSKRFHRIGEEKLSLTR